MNNFTVRAITGAVYVVLTILCLSINEWLAASYLAVISLFCFYEFLRLHKSSLNTFTIVWVVTALFSFILWPLGVKTAAIGLLALPVLPFIYQLKTKASSENWQILLSGAIYTLLPFSLLLGVLLAGGYFNGSLGIMIFVLIWCADTFAYLAGRMFGKTKLAPSISPGKTVEGVVGGISGSIVASIVFHQFKGDFSIWFYIWSAVVISIAGVLGDLFESKLKRNAGVKDSSNLLPGHGGFLDRFDSLLLVAPVYYVFYYFYLGIL